MIIGKPTRLYNGPMVETVELLREWLEPRLEPYSVTYSNHDNNLMIVVGQHDASVGIYIKDTIATIVSSSEFNDAEEINLCDPDSLQRILTIIANTIQHTIISPKMTVEDKAVLVDMLAERLPMVWQDAMEAVAGGEDIESVILTMHNGHVLRVLDRLGYDNKWFTDEFRAFVVGER